MTAKNRPSGFTEGDDVGAKVNQRRRRRPATARMAGATSERDAGLALLSPCSPMSDRQTAPGITTIASDNRKGLIGSYRAARSAVGDPIVSDKDWLSDSYPPALRRITLTLRTGGRGSFRQRVRRSQALFFRRARCRAFARGTGIAPRARPGEATARNTPRRGRSDGARGKCQGKRSHLPRAASPLAADYPRP